MDFQFYTDTYEKERKKARALKQTRWWINRKGEGVCHYCRGRFHPKELTMDHKVPISRGGTSSRANVVPCCAECNKNKQYLTAEEWRAYLEKALKVSTSSREH